MPVLKVKNNNGTWEDIATAYTHEHTMSDITDIPASLVDDVEALKDKVGAHSVAYQVSTAVEANNYTHPETHPANMITGLSNVAISGSYNDLVDVPEEVQSDWSQTDDTQKDFIKNKPEIPSIEGLATKTYVDEQIASIDVSSDGSFEQVQSDWDETDESSPAYIKNKPAISGDGGASVQANWEQSDSTQADYIKNKPFGDFGTVLTEFILETTLPFDYDESSGAYLFQMTPPSEYLKTWNGDWEVAEVVWDGTTYTCQAQYVQGIKSIGNVGVMLGTEGTGEPFIIMMADAATYGQDICVMYSLTDDTSGTETKYHTGSTSIYQKNIVKLPLKYSHRPDWNESNASNGGYIANKPFYTITAGTVIVPETTVSCNTLAFENLYYTSIDPINNIGAYNYRIEFDGVICEVNGGQGYFAYDDETVLFQIDPAGILMSTQGEHTFKITLLEDAVYKIDEKYLPEIKALPEVTTDDNDKVLSVVDGAWAVAERNWDTLKNKPFYEETYSAGCSFATTASIPTVKFTLQNTMTYYKLADFALTQEQLLQSTLTFDVNEDTYEFPITTESIQMITDDFAILQVDDFPLMIAYRAGSMAYSGATWNVPKVGIYIGISSGFTLPAPVDVNILCEYVKTLDARYIPEIDSLPKVTTDDNGKTLIVSDGAWAVASGLPKITTDDNNKALKVVDGAWTVSDILPVVTSEDAGKFLRVSVDGTWAAVTIPNAEEVGF